MSQLVVAVKSSHKDQEAGRHDVIRGTWGQELKRAGVEVMFFMGQDPNLDKGSAKVLKRDEVILDCLDTLVAKKVRGIAKWAVSKKITHLFLCNVSTTLIVEKFLALPYEPFDYAGDFLSFQPGDPLSYTDPRYAWASEKEGYFISRVAAEIVADLFPTYSDDDVYVAQCLGPEIRKGLMFGMTLDMKDAVL